MSINRYPETGDDAVTLTDNDAGRSISMSMIFELFYQQHSALADQFYCSHHIFFCYFHDIFACGNNSSYY